MKSYFKYILCRTTLHKADPMTLRDIIHLFWNIARAAQPYTNP